MTKTPLEQLKLTIAPEGCRVTNLPKRVWVFGGAIAPDTTHPSKSLRDSFWRQQLAMIKSRPWFENLDRPENHQGWWAFSGYDNLLEFERDACYLSSQIIIFSESPGSHAELGALAADDHILPKLFVVVQQKYLEEDVRESFLNLGPLKRIELLSKKCVIASEGDLRLEQDDFDAVVESFESSFPAIQHKREELNAANPMHQLLLIADLVDLMLVSKLSDVQQALEHFNVKLANGKLQRALSLLFFFGFIRLEIRGTEYFWVRAKGSDAPWIDYTSASQDPFDRGRFKVRCQELVESDKRRNSIFQRRAA